MPTDLIVVDGNAVGAIQNVVLNERKILKREGIFVVIVLINQRTKVLKKSPDIIPAVSFTCRIQKLLSIAPAMSPENQQSAVYSAVVQLI